MERTCVACRKKFSWDGQTWPQNVLRVVRVGLVITPDPTQVLPGRGAWIHTVCIAQSIERKSFRAAFKSAENFDLSLLEKFITDETNELDAKVMKLK